MSEVADKVKAIIVDKLGVDESEVTETASSEKISTVGDAISYIENELNK